MIKHIEVLESHECNVLEKFNAGLKKTRNRNPKI